MEEPDDGFLKFFALDLCAAMIWFTFLTMHFMFRGEFFMKVLFTKGISLAALLLKMLLQWQAYAGFQKDIFG